VTALSAALIAYEQSGAGYRSRAHRVPDDLWARARAEGKWSPAEETEHVVLSHELFLAQLRGGPPMRTIATGWRQVALHWLVLPYILRTGRFPRARAPRESRPVVSGAGREDLLIRLDAAVRGVIELVGRGDNAVVRTSLRHPYFGTISVLQAVRLSAVHTDHHARRLPETDPSPA
jgi:hypothetical protein